MRSLLDTGRIVDQDGKELMSGLEVRYFYEVSRIKDSELIQRLVDQLSEVDECLTDLSWHTDRGVLQRTQKVLAAAEAVGFKPSSQ